MNPQRVIVALLLMAVAAPLGASICVNKPDAVRGIRGIVVTNDPLPLQVLPGTTISLKRGKVQLEAIADEDGYFRFGRLAPGKYELRASLEGFLSAYAVAVVSSRSPSSLVLLIRLTDRIEGCSYVGSIAADEAAKFQQAGSGSSAVAAPNKRLQPAQPAAAFSRVRYHLACGLRG